MLLWWVAKLRAKHLSSPLHLEMISSVSPSGFLIWDNWTKPRLPHFTHMTCLTPQSLLLNQWNLIESVNLRFDSAKQAIQDWIHFDKLLSTSYLFHISTPCHMPMHLRCYFKYPSSSDSLMERLHRYSISSFAFPSCYQTDCIPPLTNEILWDVSCVGRCDLSFRKLQILFFNE